MEYEVKISISEIRSMVQDKLRNKNLALAGKIDDFKIDDSGITAKCKDYSPPTGTPSYWER